MRSLQRIAISLLMAAGFLLGHEAKAQQATCPAYSTTAKVVSTSTYTLGTTDFCQWIVFTASGAININLPATSFYSGFEAGFLPLSGTITFTTVASNTGHRPTVNGSNTLSLGSSQGSTVRYGKDSNWYSMGGGASGAGTGSVTSVNAVVPAWLSVTGGPITGAGVLTITSASQSANLFLSSPNGSSGVLTPRAIVNADLPSALAPTSLAITGITGSTQCLQVDTSGNVSGSGGVCGGGGGAVSSVSGTSGQITVTPTTGATVVSLPSTITSAETFSGAVTLNGALSGTGLTNYLAAPAAIGGTTAAAGRFTTVTSTIATGTAPLTVASTTNVPNLNASSLSGATFAAPGAIGGTTPAAGAFTTLNASGNLTTNVTGSTQCLHVNTSGVVSGTSSDCGTSSGGAGVGVAGGESPVTVGDVNSTIASGHYIIQTSAVLTAARTWTLPSCATFGQHLFSFWDKANGITSTNTGTLARAGSDTIGNAGTTLTMAAAGASVILECDGTSQWSVAGTVPPFTPVTNQFVTGISASGVWSAAQPTCANISNAVASCSTLPTLVLPITYVPGINPNNIPIFRANASRTVTAIVCRPEVAAGGTATITVVKAASGTALSAGTALHSGSFNANGTAATDQVLTVTVPSLAAGDTVGIKTTGTTIWTSSGVATGVCTVYMQ